MCSHVLFKSFKGSINPITNPNPVYSYNLSRDNILFLHTASRALSRRVTTYHLQVSVRFLPVHPVHTGSQFLLQPFAVAAVIGFILRCKLSGYPDPSSESIYTHEKFGIVAWAVLDSARQGLLISSRMFRKYRYNNLHSCKTLWSVKVHWSHWTEGLDFRPM
jgi:hypothetical protein